ncbi:ABC transporter ATP-binding protein [Aestuariibacter halophilus]|uniref:ABC transporter ATP-binding protein n=1 Tax=Fluctibacter halophilus TaxID=226011 RepID=A0ABS8G894_9ALTE|nr:ABC transporter ATP-binding protein [Aestuariibacter halophilus]MCC2616738.1 ABC transporter ATP-binding protein [Aestuariibacter halophilus]
MITLKQLNKWYPSGEEPLHVLKDINLTIAQGDYLSIMGPSGSGKSTLLNMLGLLDVIDEGEYWLEDQPTHQMTEEQRARLRSQHLGFIFQNFQLINRLSAAENVALPLVLAEVPKDQRDAMVKDVLSKVGLLERAHHRPGQLSGGQLQRVAIARAIVTQPKVILADEPTGNLDQTSGHDIIHLLESLNQQGLTLLVVTHDMEMGKRALRKVRMVDGVLSEQ